MARRGEFGRHVAPLGRGRAAWGLAVCGLFVALAGAIMTSGRSEPRYRPGQWIDRTQFSRVAFKSLNQIATEEARKQAADETPRVYAINTSFLEEMHKRLAKLPETVASVSNPTELAEDVQAGWGLDGQALQALQAYLQEGKANAAWEKLVEKFSGQLRALPILDSERYQLELQNIARTIRISDDNGRVPESALINQGDEERMVQEFEGLTEDFSANLRRPILHYFVNANQPILKYDPIATDQDRKARSDAVAPQFTSYEPNQALIVAGKILDEDSYKLLMHERREYLASLPWTARLMRASGPYALLGMLTTALAAVVLQLRPRIARNPMRSLALAALLGGTLAPAWGARSAHTQAAAGATVAPVVLTAVILAIVYDQRLALIVGAFQAIVVGMTLGQSVAMYAVTVLACLVAVAQLKELRRRELLIRMGLVTGTVACLGVFAIGFFEKQYAPVMPGYLVQEAGNTFLGVVAVGFFALGVLPFIERVFKVTTAMTLLELADMDHPLLRRLSQEAPGTFSHSLQVAVLAEAGAEAIGANGLLARVGAYYHDAGKIHKPQYFVENQVGGINRHEKLSPAMSLLIIVAHVKDGVELAREYGLPPILYQFIETHHGTTLVEYFYHAARRGKEESRQPREFEFRYPGPKPQTKEAAVLMICDAAESSCRSLTEPTLGRIEQMVNRLVNKRLMDGQFDACEITFNELRLVSQAVSKALASIYHSRLPYPGDRQAHSETPIAVMAKPSSSSQKAVG